MSIASNDSTHSMRPALVTYGIRREENASIFKLRTKNMSLNSLLIRTVLCVFLILLASVSNSYSRSLSSDVEAVNTTTGKPAEVVPPKEREFVNFVDGECPPTKNVNVNNILHNCENLCTADADCNGDNKCCHIDCGFTCVEPWFPKQVLDWDNSRSSSEIYGNGILEEFNGPAGGEPCSTSILDGMEPLKCPSHYVCLIITDGDEQLNIPNRGECVIKEHQEISKTNRGSQINDDSQNTGCLYKGKKYRHEEKIQKDCIMCVCYKAVIFCGSKPCRVKTGIPATAPVSKPEHIDIDNEEEESGSTQNEFDDEESGSTTQDVLKKGSNSEKSFKNKESVSIERLIQTTILPHLSQETVHPTDSNIDLDSTEKHFEKSSLERSREKLGDNNNILQSSNKTKYTNLEKRLDSKAEITDDDSYVSKVFEHLNTTVKLVKKKQSSSTVGVKSKEESIELRTNNEDDFGSAQEDLEGSVFGSGHESSGTSSFERITAGSGDRKLENPTTEANIPKEQTESDLEDAVVVLQNRQESSSGENGCGFMAEKGDTTNLEMCRSGTHAKDEGSNAKKLYDDGESFEYLETTDDEH